MAGLQRSAVSFRRSGSSGFVWDDKLLAGALNQLEANQQKSVNNNIAGEGEITVDDTATAAEHGNPSRPASLTIERSQSNGGRGFRTGRVSPTIEPPSPKVSACGFCSAFGKNSNDTRRRPPKSGRRVR